MQVDVIILVMASCIMRSNWLNKANLGVAIMCREWLALSPSNKVTYYFGIQANSHAEAELNY